MEKIFLLALTSLSAAFLTRDVVAQTAQGPLERYLETAKTIVVAKCLEVGSLNIRLRADVEVQILYVVKGKETLRNITVDSQVGMQPGSTYLLRTVNEALPDRRYFKIDAIDSAIPISRSEEIDELKLLSPRVIVLRTINLRVYDLEAEIRQRKYELEALKATRVEY